MGAEALEVAGGPHLRPLVFGHVRGCLGGIPAFDRREAGAFQQIGREHAIAAGLDGMRDDLVGLLDQLHAGLANAAVIKRIRRQRLDFGQHGRIVRRLRVEPVTAEHLHANLFDLALERIGQPDAVRAAVVEDVDRFDLQNMGHVVGHVRALEGIGRHGAEIHRLAGRAVLGGEFRVGDIGIGRRRRDDRQIAFRQDRRHRLASTRHLRPEGCHEGFVGHHLLGVGGGLGRIVLAGGHGAIVEFHVFELVALDRIGRIGVVERHDGSIGNPHRGFGIRTGERHVHADLDHLVSGERTLRHPDRGSGRQASGGFESITTCKHKTYSLVAPNYARRFAIAQNSPLARPCRAPSQRITT